MTIFSLSYRPRKTKDCTVINNLMTAWQGWQVQKSTWILKRNDGCTCQAVMDDLLEHISADNEISVVEIKQKKYLNINEQVC